MISQGTRKKTHGVIRGEGTDAPDVQEGNKNYARTRRDKQEKGQKARYKKAGGGVGGGVKTLWGGCWSAPDHCERVRKGG